MWCAGPHTLRERNEVSLRPFLPRRSASGLGTRRAEPPRHRCRSSRCGRLAPPAVSQAARPRALVSNSNAVVLVIRSGGVISVGCWPHGSCLAAHDHFSACRSVGGLVFPSLVDAVRNKKSMLLPRVLACTRSQLAPLTTRHSMARLPPLAAHRARMLSDATSKAAGDAAPSAEAAAAEAAEPTKEASEAGAAEEEAAEVDPIVALEARVAELDKELADKHDQVLRALAEADNARRRATLDVEKSHKFGVSKFAKDLLEVADNLSRAADSVPEEMRSSEEHPVLKALYEGVTMTDGQLIKTFGKHGASSFSSPPPPLHPLHPVHLFILSTPQPFLLTHLSRPQASREWTLLARSSTPTSMYARLRTIPTILTLLTLPTLLSVTSTSHDAGSPACEIVRSYCLTTSPC